MKYVQKYTMLILSLHVICDIMYCLHHTAVKSAMVNLSIEVVC